MTVHDSLLALLRAQVAERPDKEFLRISDQSFTFRSALVNVEATARGLRQLGVKPGDRVGVMCDNRPEAVWSWLGTNAAQAIDVPFNAEARGRLLDYFVHDAGPRVLIGTEDYLKILADAITDTPEFVVCIGECSSRPFGDSARQLGFDELVAIDGDDPLPAPGASGTATIMYTSGTTGPSKGVMLPQRYYPVHADESHRVMRLREDDVVYCAQPLFHIDARAFLSGSLHTGATIALGRRFSVTRFWDEVRAHQATVFATIGTMLWLLYKQPARPDDAEQPARLAICSSTPREILRDFEARFGVKIIEAYGMTECVLITTAAEDTIPGRIGRPVPGLSARVVDEHDAPVPPGELGELVYRPLTHFGMMQGYWAKPNETLAAWRNLWFHTGDLVREHPDGMLEYIGRKKDSIRRRGENVSSWEVEQALAAHPQVLEVAAIGVPSEVGEEDVAILVVPRPGGDPIDPGELVEFAAKDLPRFAVPRYVEFVENLPKTPSERIEKGKVRERGITSAAWDANVALGRR